MVGQTLGKYRVLERAGRGGMGTVYRAVDETLHRDVALKVLNTDLNDKNVGRRFRAEAVAIARLNHPGIATIYELLEHDGQWLMVMEYVRGETLEDLVLRTGPLPVDRAIDLIGQALSALAHAHSMGVVHRDLKPANLMLAESGRLKVMDFGIARVAGTEHLTSVGFMMGTPAYMAPEQVLGREIDARADLYAIGCVLYFLLSGRLPFEGKTPLETAQSRLKDEPMPILHLRSDLPPWIAEILTRVLAREPAERYQSADEFRDALWRGSQGLPVAPPPPAPAEVVMETMLPGAVAIETVRPPSAALPRPAPPENPSTAETQLMGSGPFAASGQRAALHDPNTAETIIGQPSGALKQSQSVAMPPPVPPTLPPQASPASKARAAGAAPTMLLAKNPYVLAGAGAVLLLALVIWLWPRSAPPPVDTAPPPPPPAAEPATPPPPVTEPPPPATEPPPPPVSTEPPPAATTDPAASGAKPDPTASSTPSRRKPTPEVTVTFDRVRLLHITGRRAEDVDSELQFGNGHVAILPRRDTTPGISHAYKAVLRATYVRGRDPHWAGELPRPPDNLDMPSGFLGRRSDRHWLTLQGQDWFLIVSLDDSNWEQVLHTVTERTRVKIDRPAPEKK